jgi:outer membrane receptor for ferrienterochelin and colicins
MQFFKYYIVIQFILVGNIAFSQVKTDSSISFKVNGLCEQCKHRIEQAIKVNGVDSANWDVQSKILSLTYDTTIISLETIQQRILAVGHDVENIKATPTAYNSLPSCCRYRELSAQTDTLQKVKQLSDVSIISNHRSTYVALSNPFGTQIITGREFLKSACCNLSESFETNPSVDVSYNDAVTGSKQIQLLGLSGIYTQLTVENLPGPRGLATPLGLNSIPGPWVESIQLTKGIGSVVNGYESIAGQINIELKKPENSERLYANTYVNDMGKTDFNLNLSQKINDKWSTGLLLHNDFLFNKADFNKDGFRDLPTGNQVNIINRWKYDNTKGFMTQFGINILNEDRTGGQTGFDPATDKFTTNQYGLGFDIQHYEGFAKIGYIFPGKKYESIGLQLTGVDHTENDYFGLTKYDANQKTFYSNLIYQSIIGTTNNSFRTGISFSNDHYNEEFNSNNYQRTETIPGAFFEYTYNYLTKFTVVAGIRGDQNSLFGWFATPRLHIRYEPLKGTTLRFSAGRGQRTANIFAENTSVFVSSRQVDIIGSSSGKAYGLDPEVAWNEGVNASQNFKLFHRDGSLSVDFYRNDFTNQVVVDLEDVRKVKFYNLQGKSYSNSFQAELNITPVKDLDVRLAYRYFDVKTTYSGQLLQRPFVAANRAFMNLNYAVKGWKFDYTINYNGKKRIPDTQGDPTQYQLPGYSPAFILMNTQVSKTVGKKHPMDFYVGCENITGYFQSNPIVAANQPFSQYFDASLVWGPIFGRMFYAGWRLKIK